MQTLGLSSEQKPSDGMFKRLFWPTIENQYDLDLVSQQGFWLCFGVAVLSAILLTATGHTVLGSFIAVTYYLGANGVRERSIAAAVLIFLCYLLDRVSTVLFGFGGGFGAGSPIVGLIAIMLLLANVRATLLARRWRRPGATAEQTETLERSDSSFTDKLANTLPPRIWPLGRFTFYPLAGVLLLITIAGVAMLPGTRRKQEQLRQQQQEEQMIIVKPSR